ncbi:MAG: NAD-dependent epimerase/dehydratase family protein [Methanobacteriota archaeon]
MTKSGPPQSYLVTGAMGFIGSHLVESLLGLGKTVYGMDIATPAYEPELMRSPGFHFVHESIKNLHTVERLVKEVDCVCHLAAVPDPKVCSEEPDYILDITLAAAVDILRIAERHGKMVFFTSTSEVYGRNPRIPWAEDDDRVLGPTSTNRWSYATAKAAVEHYIWASHKRTGLQFLTVRPFNVYGPRLRKRVVSRFLHQAIRGEPITVFGTGRQTRCFTYIDDAIEAFLRLLSTPTAYNQVYNVGHPREFTVRELAEAVQRAADRPVEIVHLEGGDDDEVSSYDFIPRRVPDVSRLRKATGWQPQVELDEGVAKTLAYEKAIHEREPGRRIG